MKINLFRTLLVSCLLTGPLCFAQTRPATQPATGSSTDTNPRRQQELYDQYNGVNKKPGQATTPTTPNSSGRFGGNASQAASSAAAKEPVKAALDGNTSGFRVGIRGGATYPIFLEKSSLIQSAYSFVGGIVFQLGAGGVSFQPEVNYARTAEKLTGFGTVTLDQIQVPLFLKFATGSVDGTRLFLNVGPYGAYAYSATLNSVKVPLDGQDGRLSYGGAAGVGVMVKAGPGHVTLEGRGYYQLGDNAKPSSGDSKTILAQATIGYIIPIGGR